jgi:CrcB protein
MNHFVAVFIGGGLGSLARYSIGLGTARLAQFFPLGTFLSNAFATLLLALFVVWLLPRLDQHAWMHSLLVIGFCGGFSTFSTFSVDTFKLAESGQGLLAVANVLINVLVCFGLAYIIMRKQS